MLTNHGSEEAGLLAYDVGQITRSLCAADARREDCNSTALSHRKAMSVEYIKNWLSVCCCVSTTALPGVDILHRVAAQSLHLKEKAPLLYLIQQNRGCLSGFSS